LPEVLKGKRVLLVEDSIVRSTTMRALVHEIRDRGGAREIHLRVACPPIVAPCFYGIDMSSRDELFAPRFSDQLDGGVSLAAQQAMAEELGADSLRYLPVEAIARAVGLSSERLCRACVTGAYPTPTGEALYQIQLGGGKTSCGTVSDPRRAYERELETIAGAALEPR
jgi:amidophosphoribosyltransferase